MGYGGDPEQDPQAPLARVRSSRGGSLLGEWVLPTAPFTEKVGHAATRSRTPESDRCPSVPSCSLTFHLVSPRIRCAK